MKVTVTVMMTGTFTPLSVVGEYRHPLWLTVAGVVVVVAVAVMAMGELGRRL